MDTNPPAARVEENSELDHDPPDASRDVLAAVLAELEKRGVDLARSERRLSTIMGNIQGMAFRCTNDRDWTMAFVSEGSEALTGYQPHELIGNSRVSFGQLIHPDDREIVHQAVQTAVAAGEPWKLAYRIRKADGEEVWVWDYGFPVFAASGELEALEGFIHDITSQKKIEAELRVHRDHLAELVAERTEDLVLAKERAEAANLAKSEFLTNISHELRTPMHAVLSFAKIGLRKATDAEQGEYFGKIHASGSRLLKLLDDLLDLSKLEAGQIDFQPLALHPVALLETGVAEVESLLAEKDLTLVFDREAHREVRVWGDQACLLRVFANLLGNAIKFSPRGARIELRCAVMDAGDQAGLVIDFRDHGVGVPPPELDSVFDKFVQSSKTKTGAGGTGLGLAICREIIDRHQGRIWAEAPERGALFRVWLPRSN